MIRDFLFREKDKVFKCKFKGQSLTIHEILKYLILTFS